MDSAANHKPCHHNAEGLSDNIWTNGFECCAGGGLSSFNHGIILQGDARCAFFDRYLRSRDAIEFHAFAPLEALACV
jgi:hypothetical protein